MPASRSVLIRQLAAYGLKEDPEIRPLLLGERRRFGDHSFDIGVDPLLLLALAFLPSLLFAHAFFGHINNSGSGSQGVPAGLAATTAGSPGASDWMDRACGE
jgi:hypothetical protein